MVSKGFREAMCKQGWGVSCGVHLTEERVVMTIAKTRQAMRQKLGSGARESS